MVEVWLDAARKLVRLSRVPPQVDDARRGRRRTPDWKPLFRPPAST